MKRYSCLLTLFIASQVWGADHAKNVILFLGDAAGLPTLNAASIHSSGGPTGFYIQHMPNLAFSETSSAADWITDSAAGMTAIVTGRKTTNGILSQLPGSGDQEGAALKTILEYAEEHGLSTGVISNSAMSDATPAACYAHAGSRKKTGDIFVQIWKPRYGDGVDLVLGPGRKAIATALAETGVDLATELPKHGYWYGNSLQQLPPTASRAVVLTDDGDFDISAATRTAIAILSRNPKGFFLMVESDLHADKLQRGLERVPVFDRLIQQTAKDHKKDSLVIFTADHSFDLRTVQSLAKGKPLFMIDEAGKAVPAKAVTVNGHHAGEPVLVAAEGPGAQRVHGFLANTDLFQLMLQAWGWKQDVDATK